MNPWIVIDQATVPGDGGEMKLLQRAHEFTITVKNEELMNSRLHGSEDALAELTCKPLAIRRQADVARVINEKAETYDAILLDVDNGPEGLTHAGNDRLYTQKGLAAAKAALKPGGVLAVWSAQPDKQFAKRLRAAEFGIKEIPVRARGTRGRWHTIWLAEKKQLAAGKKFLRR